MTRRNALFKPEALAPLLAGCLPLAASADFIDHASVNLSMRNFYFNRDFRQQGAAQSKREEWAQGFALDARSGYTEGLIGLGLDLYGAFGIKLDSADNRAGTGLLPNRFGDAGPDQYGDVSGRLKAKVSKTEIKYGGFTPRSPILLTSDARLLTPLFNGLTVESREVDDWVMEAGRLTSVNYRDSSANHDDFIAANYGVTSDRFDYFGSTWAVTPQTSLAYWYAELEDVYKQQYLGYNGSQKLNDWTLTANLGYFDSAETGARQAGNIDNRLITTWVSANHGAHTLRLGYQRNNGDSPFPHLQDADSNVANVVQVLDFTRAGERSWQARYDYNFAALGVPGLTAFVRYLRGDGYQVGNDEGREWERDLDVSYVVQGGPLKNLGIRWRNASMRSDTAGDVDENRLILSYSIPLK